MRGVSYSKNVPMPSGKIGCVVKENIGYNLKTTHGFELYSLIPDWIHCRNVIALILFVTL